MALQIYKNFITKKEVELLNTFALDSINKGKFKNGALSGKVNPPNSQMVSRFSPELIFPEKALNIQKTIQTKFKLSDNLINKDFNKFGIIVNVSFKNAQVLKHKDLNLHGFSALRCNIVTSQPKDGGVLHVNDKPVILDSGDLYTCLFSEHEHYVTKNNSNNPRIVWQFAFHVKKEDWYEFNLS
jgi:hypothetical protein